VRTGCKAVMCVATMTDMSLSKTKTSGSHVLSRRCGITETAAATETAMEMAVPRNLRGRTCAGQSLSNRSQGEVESFQLTVPPREIHSISEKVPKFKGTVVQTRGPIRTTKTTEQTHEGICLGRLLLPLCLS